MPQAAAKWHKRRILARLWNRLHCGTPGTARSLGACSRQCCCSSSCSGEGAARCNSNCAAADAARHSSSAWRGYCSGAAARAPQATAALATAGNNKTMILLPKSVLQFQHAEAHLPDTRAKYKIVDCHGGIARSRKIMYLPLIDKLSDLVCLIQLNGIVHDFG